MPRTLFSKPYWIRWISLALLMATACDNVQTPSVSPARENNTPSPPVSSTQAETSTPATQTSPSTPAVSQKTPPTPSSQPSHLTDPFELALETAHSAVMVSSDAQTAQDWQQAMEYWQTALDLLQTVPPSSPYQALIPIKVTEYEEQLAYAKRQVSSSASGDSPERPKPDTRSPQRQIDSATPSPSTTQINKKTQIFRIPIKRRLAGTPIIDVTFNGQRTLEMIVDTGASATVVTQKNAKLLDIVPVGKARVNTASERNVTVPVGFVDSIEINGALVKHIPVAIAGPELDIGLLGHDVLSQYDLTIKRDVIELSPRL